MELREERPKYTPGEMKLLMLADTLRDEHKWPNEFRKRGWNYGDCTTCAMQLGLMLLGKRIENLTGTKTVQELLGANELSDDEFYRVFAHGNLDKEGFRRFHGSHFLRMRFASIQPKDVAAWIEEAVAKRHTSEIKAEENVNAV